MTTEKNPHARRQGWDQAIAEEREQCSNRRARVLAHPDIAQRLTDRPMSYARPDQWTGYIPPYLVSGEKVNSSPIRHQLVAICVAVNQREKDIAAGIPVPTVAPEPPDETPEPPEEEPV
jgi:hypothetical protein